MKQKSDLELVLLVQEKNSEALAELYTRYLPMINGVIRRYFLRAFDKADWHQEAMLICYESCCAYEPEKLVKFGGFFQLKLINHARNLVRYETAKKRAPYSRAVSYEKELEKEDCVIKESSLRDQPLSIKEMDEFVHSLSLIEIVAFRCFLGTMTKKEAMHVARCNDKQLQSAYNRCYQKFKLFM